MVQMRYTGGMSVLPVQKLVATLIYESLSAYQENRLPFGPLFYIYILLQI